MDLRSYIQGIINNHLMLTITYTLTMDLCVHIQGMINNHLMLTYTLATDLCIYIQDMIKNHIMLTITYTVVNGLMCPYTGYDQQPSPGL